MWNAALLYAAFHSNSGILVWVNRFFSITRRGVEEGERHKLSERESLCLSLYAFRKTSRLHLPAYHSEIQLLRIDHTHSHSFQLEDGLGGELNADEVDSLPPETSLSTYLLVAGLLNFRSLTRERQSEIERIPRNLFVNLFSNKERW